MDAQIEPRTFNIKRFEEASSKTLGLIHLVISSRAKLSLMRLRGEESRRHRHKPMCADSVHEMAIVLLSQDPGETSEGMRGQEATCHGGPDHRGVEPLPFTDR